MPGKLTPDAVFRNITDISPDFLEELCIKGLILDVDNTIAKYSESVPGDDIRGWCEKVKAKEIKLFILSNSKRPDRVRRMSEAIGAPFIYRAGKPSRRGFMETEKKLGLRGSEIAVVGDQIFTDVLGAKRAGMRAFIVYPLGMDENILFRLRRLAETPFIRMCKSRYDKEQKDV